MRVDDDVPSVRLCRRFDSRSRRIRWAGPKAGTGSVHPGRRLLSPGSTASGGPDRGSIRARLGSRPDHGERRRAGQGLGVRERGTRAAAAERVEGPDAGGDHRGAGPDTHAGGAPTRIIQSTSWTIGLPQILSIRWPDPRDDPSTRCPPTSTTESDLARNRAVRPRHRGVAGLTGGRSPDGRGSIDEAGKSSIPEAGGHRGPGRRRGNARSTRTRH